MEWINVEDRLPQIPGKILVIIDGTIFLGECYFCSSFVIKITENNVDFQIARNSFLLEDVKFPIVTGISKWVKPKHWKDPTHWMQLPELPKK